jgi:O-antigen/teichoic acid export membrane protein
MGQAWATTLLAQGRLMSVTRLTATAAIASLVLNALFTPRWHALGAAIAAVCVQAITWGQSLITTSREFRHCLDRRARALVAGILFLPLLQLAAALCIPGSWASTAARTAIWLAAVGILRYTGLLGELRGFVQERLRALPWFAPKSNGNNELR